MSLDFSERFIFNRHFRTHEEKTMHPLFEEFIQRLESENREECIRFVLSKLSSGELDILTTYNELLAPSLNNMECKGPEDYCIWKEHVRSSIVRAIIENCYLRIIEERDTKFGKVGKGRKVIVVCPTEELHEIGPRMAADFFTLLGFDVTFVGANTPRGPFLSAIDAIGPEFVGVSVTNYYNLVVAKKIVEEIRERKGKEIKIIVGGRAFASNPEFYKEIGADLLAQSFDDIRKIAEGA